MQSDPTVSLHFLHFHRGRQSVVLDRDTPEGYDAFERLVASADVLVEDESSASLDHEALRALTPASSTRASPDSARAAPARVGSRRTSWRRPRAA